MMTARDEKASFRIFSTLNGRGMDLSEVDKLKADLLQVHSASMLISHVAPLACWYRMPLILLAAPPGMQTLNAAHTFHAPNIACCSHCMLLILHAVHVACY